MKGLQRSGILCTIHSTSYISRGREVVSRKAHNLKAAVRFSSPQQVNAPVCAVPMWFVYILRCKDESLYTGITTDLERRLSEHRSGKGANYTASHEVIERVYSEECENRSVASKREAEIKKLSRTQKLELIAKKL